MIIKLPSGEMSHYYRQLLQHLTRVEADEMEEVTDHSHSDE
jgi:hypothetical protein